MKDSSPFLPPLRHPRINFLLLPHAHFRSLFPVLLFASGSPCGMEDLFFDPSSGKLHAGQFEPYQSFSENAKGKTMWIDRCTGKIFTDICKVRFGRSGFFGGVCSSALAGVRGKSSSSIEFEDKVRRMSTSDSGGVSPDRFYKIQSLQIPGKEGDRVVVPIWIARDPNIPRRVNVAPAWIEHLQQAIKDINYAAPGLFLYITTNPLKAQIKIAQNNQNNVCFARGSILETTCTEIFLCSEWSEMKRTSCHELLHALGFKHEHQRRDRESSIHQNWQRSREDGDDEDDEIRQYKIMPNVMGITRFDLFSILLYSEDEKLSRNRGDPVWITKPNKCLDREMSELDKVALNNVYRPCEGPNYSPTKFGRSVTGFKYCGRWVTFTCKLNARRFYTYSLFYNLRHQS